MRRIEKNQSPFVQSHWNVETLPVWHFSTTAQNTLKKKVICAVHQKVAWATSLHFSATAQREIGFALSYSSNSEPNLLQLVSLKRDCKGDRLLFGCLLFHQQSSIIVITLNIFGTGTLSSILVELHKMIGMLHAPDSYFFSQHALLI